MLLVHGKKCTLTCHWLPTYHYPYIAFTENSPGSWKKNTNFCRACIDDLKIFSEAPDECVQHGDVVIRKHLALDVTPSPSKSFIGHSSASLLDMPTRPTV